MNAEVPTLKSGDQRAHNPTPNSHAEIARKVNINSEPTRKGGGGSDNPPLRMLCVANKKLPDHDYRVIYSALSEVCELSYALPDKPDTVAEQQFHSIGFREGLSVDDAKHFWQLFKLLRRERFDVVHFYSTKLVLIGPLVARLAGCKALFTLTGFGRIFVDEHWLYPTLQKLWWLLLSVSTRLSTRCFFQNRSDQAMMEARFPKQRAKMYFAGSAVEMPTLAPRLLGSHQRPTVLCVSRLLPSKGVPDVLELARRIEPDQAKFVLIGPISEAYPELQQEAMRLVAEGRLDYRGEQHGEALRSAFAEANIFLFLSYLEGMPRVMLEAGFSGLCPVAYDIQANRDLVPEGLFAKQPLKQPLKQSVKPPLAVEGSQPDLVKAGLVKTGDVDAAHQQLLSLLRSPALIAEHAAIYQQHIQSGYSPEAFCQRMDSHMSELVMA